jgi:hypothetical protein
MLRCRFRSACRSRVGFSIRRLLRTEAGKCSRRPFGAAQSDELRISGSGARGCVNSDFARRIQKNAPKDHKRVFLLGIQNPFLFDKTKRKRGLGTHFFFVLQIVFAAAEKTVRRVRSAGTGETSRTTFFCRRQKKAFLGLRKKRRLEAPPEVPTNLSGAQNLNCLCVMRRCR